MMVNGKILDHGSKGNLKMNPSGGLEQDRGPRRKIIKKMTRIKYLAFKVC